MDKVRLSAEDVENYIKTATRETPLGLFQFGNNEKSLVVDGQFKSVSALKDLKIPLSIAGQGQSSDSNDIVLVVLAKRVVNHLVQVNRKRIAL